MPSKSGVVQYQRVPRPDRVFQSKCVKRLEELGVDVDQLKWDGDGRREDCR